MTIHSAADRTAGRSAPQCLTERLAALFAAGVLALNYPLLALFAGELHLLGVPLLYLYLLLVWALLIAGTALLMRRRPGPEYRSSTTAADSAEPRP